MSTINDIVDNFNDFKYDPALALSYMTHMVESASGPGFTISNLNNPFIKSLECLSVSVASFNQEQHSIHRRLYPSVATNLSDLYYHISDKDMVNAFAAPAAANFDIRFSLEEVLSKLEEDSSTGYKKMVIPRDTNIVVAGLEFTLQHPIEVRQMPHSGLQVVYILDKENPVESLKSNYVNWSIERLGNIDLLKISLELKQYKIATFTDDLQQSQGFVVNASFDDNFFLARAFVLKIVSGVSEWVELKTTYNPNIYDPTDDTVVFRVDGQTLTASVPSIYTARGLVGKLRIDVYSTKGELSYDLSQVSSNDFKVVWKNIDQTEINQYTEIVQGLRTLLVTSPGFVTGGRSYLSFDQLRQRVINNSYGQNEIPITPNDITSDLNDLGYTVELRTDSITQRTFIASKNLSKPKDSSILTAASCACLTLNTTMTQASAAYGAYRNGDRVVLTDRALYKNEEGILSVLSTLEANTILNETKSNLAIILSRGQYYYSPFVYVLDSSSELFDLRAYYMDSPYVSNRLFVTENETSMEQASVSDNFILSRTDTGYILDITLNGSESTLENPETDLLVQMSFKSVSQDNIMYQNAQYMGLATDNKPWFRFTLNTNYDIDSSHKVDFSSFEGATSALGARADLKQKFNIVIAKQNTNIPNTFIDKIGDVFVQTKVLSQDMPITHEIFELNFGVHMDFLWRRSRSIFREKTYKKHLTSKQKVYEEDVYATTDGLPFTFTQTTLADGTIITNIVENILHHKGDLVFDDLGDPVYEYRAGDLVLDANGQFVLDDSYVDDTSRLIDLFLIDGQYRFVSEPIVSGYRKSFTEELVQWIQEDLVEYDKKLLEQTKIFFYAKNTTGPLEVYTEQGSKTTISSQQPFSVKLTLKRSVYENDPLLKELERSTILAISDYLSNNITISISEIQSKLRDIYQKDIIDVSLSSPAFTKYKALVLKDDSSRMSIKKKLFVGTDSKVYILEDVDFSYIIL